jgi:hypothetical protein
MSTPWYETVAPDAPLDQGCLIDDCPVIGWRNEPILVHDTKNAVNILQSATEIAQVDLVVSNRSDGGERFRLIACLALQSPECHAGSICFLGFRSAQDEGRRRMAAGLWKV